MLGSETAETNLRTMGLLGVERDESADDAVPMLFAAADDAVSCCFHAICSCWG